MFPKNNASSSCQRTCARWERSSEEKYIWRGDACTCGGGGVNVLLAEQGVRWAGLNMNEIKKRGVEGGGYCLCLPRTETIEVNWSLSLSFFCLGFYNHLNNTTTWLSGNSTFRSRFSLGRDVWLSTRCSINDADIVGQFQSCDAATLDFWRQNEMYKSCGQNKKKTDWMRKKCMTTTTKKKKHFKK